MSDTQTMPAVPTPIDMVLFCPKCGLQHIDAPEDSMLAGDAALYGGDWPGRWLNPPHRSHECQGRGCRHVWRPADVPTNGVAAIKTSGKKDDKLVDPAARRRELQERIVTLQDDNLRLGHRNKRLEGELRLAQAGAGAKT
jgi:hypothetical protein